MSLAGFSDPIADEFVAVNVQNLATTMMVSAGQAHQVLTNTVEKLRNLRVGKAKQDPVVGVLDKVLAALKAHTPPSKVAKLQARLAELKMLVALTKWDERQHPRDERGRFATAFEGKQVKTRKKLSKLETGEIGERVVTDYFKSIGMKDTRSLNIKGNNFPIDLAGDHTVMEVKTGLVSNGPGAQQWRATIGQPGKEESKWLKTASADEKRDWNAAKAQAIIDRKEATLKQLEKERGVELKAKTVGVIIHPDKRLADIHVFDGFHHRIGWKSDVAKAGYVKTVRY